MRRTLLIVAALLCFAALPAAAAKEDCHPGPGAKCVEHDDSIFGSDPTYEDKPYSAEAQKEIYGGKHLNPTQRPGLELGRRLYSYGPFRRSPTLLGEANPMSPQLLVFGDMRTAVAAIDSGGKHQFNAAQTQLGIASTRVNIDVDLKLTATERIHAFWNPLQRGANAKDFTRCEFAGADARDCIEFEFEPEPEAYFFEGDLGYMVGGLIGREAPFDMPIAGGLVPLLFQNGIWVEDAFFGGAFTIPARNSRTLDISNFDVTFFVGADRVATPLDAEQNDGRIYGVTTFLETMGGYWELGYGFTEDKKDLGRGYHNMTAAFTRRYRDWFSNSIRVIGNVGQTPSGRVDRATLKNGDKAEGVALLIENSLITRWPSNVVPYMNAFVGFENPQPLARGAGLLKNTGIAFETDALTGFPFLLDFPQKSAGGAIGLEILGPRFNWQVVAEISGRAVYDKEDRDGNGEVDAGPDQIGAALRFQFPLTNALILRLDGIYALQTQTGDLRAARAELRYKY